MAGATRLYAIIFSFSVLIWLLYDLIGKDMVGIERIKRNMAEAINGMQNRNPRAVPAIIWSMRITLPLQFLFYSWQLIPPLVVQCYRSGGKRMHLVIEIPMMALSSLILTVWWSFVSITGLTCLSAIGMS